MKRSHRGVKTTLEIPEPLWRAAKQRALDDDLDMRAVVICALEAFLRASSSNREPLPPTVKSLDNRNQGEDP